jgi:hypothetical protein
MALLHDVEVYLKSGHLAPSRLGRAAVGDPRFVFDLRGGRVPGLRTESRIRQFLQTTTPETRQTSLPEGAVL